MSAALVVGVPVGGQAQTAGLVTGTVIVDVFEDDDGDAEWGSEEAGLGEALVRLTVSSGLDVDAAVQEGTTDSSGRIIFEDVAEGSYRVEVDASSLPPGEFSTGGTVEVTVEADQEVFAEVGFVRHGSVSATVWQDDDLDDIKEAGEDGAAGVTMDIALAGPDGTFRTADDVVVASATTDDAGAVEPMHVAPGEYLVAVRGDTLPAGYARPSVVDGLFVSVGAAATESLSVPLWPFQASVPLDVAPGRVTTLAGQKRGGAVDGAGADAMFEHTQALAARPDLAVVVQDGRVRTVTLPDANVSTLAGTGTIGCADSEDPALATFGTVSDVVMVGDSAYLGSASCQAIRRVSLSSGATSTVVSFGQAVDALMVAPDGRLAALLGREIHLVDAQTGEQHVLTTLPRYIHDIAMGEQDVWYRSYDRLYRWSLSRPGETFVTEGEYGDGLAVTRGFVYVGRGSAYVSRYDVEADTWNDVAGSAETFDVIDGVLYSAAFRYNDSSKDTIAGLAVVPGALLVLDGRSLRKVTLGVVGFGQQSPLVSSPLSLDVPHAQTVKLVYDISAIVGHNGRPFLMGEGSYPRLYELDLTTGYYDSRVANLPCQDGSMASDGEVIWLACGGLHRLDPDTGARHTTGIAADTVTVGPDGSPLVTVDTAVRRVDVDTMTTTDVATLPSSAAATTADADFLWAIIGGSPPSIQKVDLVTGEVSTLVASSEVAGGFSWEALVSTRDYLFVAEPPFGDGIRRFAKSDGSSTLAVKYDTVGSDGVGSRAKVKGVRRLAMLSPSTLLVRERDEDSRYDSKIRLVSEASAFSRRGQALGHDAYGGWVGGVNVGLGGFTHQQADVELADPGPSLEFARTYNSADDRLGGPLGLGWSHSYDMSWVADDLGRVSIRYPDGRREVYTPDGAGGFDPPAGYSATLTGSEADGYTLTAKDRTTYVFDSSGRLTSISDGNARQLSLTYTDGQLASVVGASGRALSFTWSAGRITQVSTGPVDGVALTWTYGYTSGRLDQVCDPRSTTDVPVCTRYEYDVAGNLTRIVRPEGNDEVTVGYDALGRVDWRENGVGDRTTFAYAPGVTVSEDARGNRRTHRFDSQYRVVEEIDALDHSTTYTYDERGFRDSITDANGARVELDYDTHGNVLSETNGEGERTWHTYNAAHDLTATRDGRSSDATDPTYMTAWTYDSAGNRLTETTPPTDAFPNGTTTTWTYTDGTETGVDGGTVPPGLMATATDANGNQTHYRYDSDGDLRETLDPSGLTTTYGHDELGRLTISTAHADGFPDGITTSYTYDAVGNLTSETAPPVTNAVSGEVHQRRTIHDYDLNDRIVATTVEDIAGTDPARTTQYGYDEADRERESIDPEDGRTFRTFDPAGNVATVTDPEGRTRRIDYDARNQPIRETLIGFDADPTDPANQVRDLVLAQYGYDPAGRKISETGANGTTIRLELDRSDRLLSRTVEAFEDPDGTVRDLQLEAYGYDAAGNVVRHEEGGGRRVTTTRYDAAGRALTTTLDPGGLDRVTTFSYDANGNITREASAQDGETVEVRRTFDPGDRPLSETTENGGSDLTTWFQYDNRGLPTHVTDPRGATAGDPAFTTESTYDAAGRKATETLPPVTVVTYNTTPTTTRPSTATGYDTFGNPTHDRDANGTITVTTYDKLDRRTLITHPTYTPPASGSATTPTETFTYDRVGNLTQQTSRRGHQTDYTYDSLNRVVARTDPPAAPDETRGQTTFAYDDLGNLTEQADPTGVVTTSRYDQLSRQTATTVYDDGTALTSTTTYDDLGNVTSETTPAGETTRRTYDAAGNPITRIDPRGEQWTTTFDVADRKTSSTEPSGMATVHQYDPAGREVATSTTPTTGPALTTTRTFDAAGGLTTETSPAGHTTEFTYDAANRLASVTTAAGSTDSITSRHGYDTAGNLTQLIDGNGHTTWHTYTVWQQREDTVEPATSQHPDAADRTFTTSYDAGGLPVTEQQPGGVTIDRTFDALGRTIEETGHGSGIGAATRTLRYDAAGRLVELSHPAGAITLQYNDRGLRTRATGPAGTTTWAYDPAGRTTERTDPAGTATFTWTQRGELATVTDPLTGGTATYTWTADGRLDLTEFDADVLPVTRTYEWDAYGRLESDTLRAPLGETQWASAYEYDADGNLTAKTVTAAENPAAGLHEYDYDKHGRLTSWTPADAAPVTYTWDANGNRIAVGTDTYTYNERNQLIADPAGSRTYDPRGTLATSSDGTITYTFDGLGRMTGYTQGPDSVALTYDSTDRIATRNGTPFQYSGLSQDPTTDGTFTYAHTPTGRLVALQGSGTEASRAVLDRHGDLAGWMASGGSLEGSRIYDPFGDPVATTGTLDPTRGYQSDWTDPTIGDVWMGARWYQPSTATFRSRDTYQGELKTPVSLNRYTYAHNNPLRYFDPDGRAVCETDRCGGPGEQRMQRHGTDTIERTPETRAADRRKDDLAAGRERGMSDAKTATMAGWEAIRIIEDRGIHRRPEPALAGRRRAAIGLEPFERSRLIGEFFSAFPGPRETGVLDRLLAGQLDLRSDQGLGMGRAILDFTDWEIQSGRLDPEAGSDWWKAVNGQMMLDIRDAHALVGSDGLTGAQSDSVGVQRWIEYARAANSSGSEADVQSALWLAHQTSLHQGVRGASDLLAHESALERAFIGTVVENVDIAAVLNDRTNDLAVGAFVNSVYPTSYPASLSSYELAFSVTYAGAIDQAAPPELRFLLRDTGLKSSRWP